MYGNRVNSRADDIHVYEPEDVRHGGVAADLGKSRGFSHLARQIRSCPVSPPLPPLIVIPWLPTYSQARLYPRLMETVPLHY